MGVLASKEGNPVVIASGNLDNAQRSMIDSKNVKEVIQVGDGNNQTAFKQAVDILNDVQVPEAPVDGIKIPKINYAKENRIKINTKYGQPIGGGGMESAEIKGDLYVKFGDSILGAHAYGSNNQEQYDYSYNWVKDKIKSVKFRNSYSWVNLQIHLQGGKPDNYIDPILKANGITSTYGHWKNEYKHLVTGLKKGIVSREDAEQIVMYRAVVSHVRSFLPKLTDPKDGTPASAFSEIKGLSDCDSSANFDSLVGDIIGMNTMVAGSLSHQDVLVTTSGDKVGYWWVNGLTPTLKKTDHAMMNHTMVISAPTYNLKHLYQGN